MTVINLVLSLLCIFEVICVPAIFLHIKLWGVVLLYAASVLLFLIVLWKKKMLPGQGKNKGTRKRERAESAKEPAAIQRIRILCILLMLYQLVIVVGYRHTDDDDAWYLGTAVSAYETGEIFAYSPYTGNPMELSDGGDYVLSPLPVLWAVLAKLLHIHPTILAHTILPVLILLFAYAVYGMLGKRLFLRREDTAEEQKKGELGAWLFFLFMNVLNLFGYYSARTSGAFLLLRSWQGKAIFCAILVPLLFYYFLGLLQKEGAKQKEELAGIYLTMGAGCLVSFTAVSLMPLLLLSMALTYAVAKRSLQIPLKMCKALLPNVILIAIYVLLL